MLEFNLEDAAREIRKRKARLAAVQLPEGLKQRLPEIVKRLESKSNAEIVAFVDPCYGACDLADGKAARVGAEILVHFGHSRFLESKKIETIYVPMHYKIESAKLNSLCTALVELLKKSGLKKIALCCAVQYLQHMHELEKILKRKGFSVFIGAGRNVMPGQVLGCNYSSVRDAEKTAQAVVFVGDGLFHAVGICFITKKPVFLFNPMDATAKRLGKEPEMFMRKRIAMVEKARHAEKFAVLLSTKPGQLHIKKALEAKRMIEDSGRNALLLAADFIKPEYLLGIDIDCIVSTACPRIAIDDSSLFRQPIINFEELKIALGKKALRDYKFSEFF